MKPTRGTIGIVAPHPAGNWGGNRVTALRWAARFRQLGWRPVLWPRRDERACDVLVALHAEKSRETVLEVRQTAAIPSIVIGCTGTDLYGTGKPSDRALQTLSLADRIVVLQQDAVERLPEALRGRTQVIHQSVEVPRDLPKPPADRFEVCVLANLRAVKDPLLPARAVRDLPTSSRIHVTLIGGALDETLGRACREEADANPRFDWTGPLRRPEALRRLASSHLLVSPSLLEGGSNAVSEALALDVPVLATSVGGSTGLLGPNHPGRFPVGDADALRTLLERSENDPDYLASLRRHGRSRAWITQADLERSSWGELLDSLPMGRQDAF